MAGRIALVGSGEYLPVMHDIEAWLLEDRPARYVQLATAAAPEGDESLARWHALGAQAAERLGVEQVVVDVRTREDAHDPKWAEMIEGAGLVYLSGGNPMFLAETLAGTRVWSAIRDAWLGGASLAGCSAGAMAMATHVQSFRHPHRGVVVGLGVVPGVRVLPHFDRITNWTPDFALRVIAAGDDLLLGIDEDTALAGEPDTDGTWQFTPRGRQSAWVVRREGKERIEGPISLPVADR